ncbi:MAG: LCP family protein [Coriobacteriia bacterium]|nr:LCP family protein [Coriobacteriia bacterium]
MRKSRSRRKSILIGVAVVATSLLIAAVVAVGIYTIVINNKLSTSLSGESVSFTEGVYENLFVQPLTEEEPFWILLMGTDETEWEPGYSRTDTLILVRVDPMAGKAAMVSIPRDLYVNIPDYGMDKINAAYSYGEQFDDETGVSLCIKTVSEFAGVDIAYFAQVNFWGLIDIVDTLGGVWVDVPVDIVGDENLGGVEIYQGLQKLTGRESLAFCRSRYFFIGDFQRQANQRTFLQALVKQILASDPATIASALSSIADITYTNMSMGKIINVAQNMKGMQESDILTYHVPVSDMPTINEISYVVADSYSWYQLINALDSGTYPPPQEDAYAGLVPDSYTSDFNPAQDMTGGQLTDIKTSDYVVDVRNGCGVDGCARSISDMLSIAGYQDGEVGNTNAYVYPNSLIIYKDPNHRQVAENIRQRMGYGRVLASNGGYEFNGDILVVVGDDFTK